VIEMQERHVAGKRTARTKVYFRIHPVKARFQNSCRDTIRPCVKITYDDPVSSDPGVFQNMTRKQFVDLLASFKKRSPHMQIGEVDRPTRYDLDLCQKAPARFV